MGLYIGKDDKKPSTATAVTNQGSKVTLHGTILSGDMVRDYLTLEVAQKIFSQGNEIGVEFSNPSRAMRISKNDDPLIKFSDLNGIRWFRIEN